VNSAYTVNKLHDADDVVFLMQSMQQHFTTSLPCTYLFYA